MTKFRVRRRTRLMRQSSKPPVAQKQITPTSTRRAENRFSEAIVHVQGDSERTMRGVGPPYGSIQESSS
jgi:hypothetical protein